MADAGLDDVLVTYNVVGAGKLERLRALLPRIDVTVSVDDAASVA
jgi:D-serine deaminase-like pyridoxal phosphate-dependent protein